MTFWQGLLVGAVALVVILVLAKLATWRRRPRAPHPSQGGRTEECEVCGAEISIVVAHLVTAAFDDDTKLGGGTPFGGTGMSAAYCVNHCPGGCSQESCPSRVVQ